MKLTAVATEEYGITEIIVCALYRFPEDLPRRYTPKEARKLLNESTRVGYLICTREYASETMARFGPRIGQSPMCYGAVSFTLVRKVIDE